MQCLSGIPSGAVRLELVVLPRHLSKIGNCAARVHPGLVRLLPVRLTIYELTRPKLSGVIPLGIPVRARRNTN